MKRQGDPANWPRFVKRNRAEQPEQPVEESQEAAQEQEATEEQPS